MSSWRHEFPFFSSGKLTFLDSAASAQKPQKVLRSMDVFAREQYANIHRGVHTLAEASSAAYESARGLVANFIGAREAGSIVFTPGTTAGINLAAESLRRGGFLQKDTDIVASALEHHSNFLPWQRAAAEVGGKLHVAPIAPNGDIDIQKLEEIFKKNKVSLLAVAHVSNVYGAVTPLAEIIALAHKYGALVMVDGAQAVAHLPVNVGELDADFYAFSAHKLYGPTGIGVLYIKPAIASRLPPFMLGGGMVHRVGSSFEETTWAPAPARFEAGTPPIIEAVGLHAAIDFVSAVGFQKIMAHEKELTQKLLEALHGVKGAQLYGTPRERVGVVAFNVRDFHPHDVGSILSVQGIAVRVGHHCAQPLMHALGIQGCVRASLGIYNTPEDIDALVRGLETVCKKLS